MSVLFNNVTIKQNWELLSPWKQDAYQYFQSMIGEKNDYPCVPARQGLKNNMLRYGFLDNVDDTKVLASSLKEYGNTSKAIGQYTSLIIFIPMDDTQATVEDYQVLFWDLLSDVTNYDTSDWPATIPDNPEHHEWEFCFDGEPYFAFCATPVHQLRKSRYFPYMMLAFQPRFVFDELNASTSYGRKMKKVIRQRLQAFDSIPAHPDLKWYGNSDNHEWKQYFIGDDDHTLSKCPFTRFKQRISNLTKMK
ncbi:YqcI/YcgG family protein [Oceanobacillus iheyensis]|uniref:YqcI/YcgG family protein n=1 Tax=Oceanobacillus iheyensis TaxID=182710 RepID=UPI003624C8B4